MTDAAARFTGFAHEYDDARPRPPEVIAALLCQWSGVGVPDVVDVGAGTGLSTLIWSGRAGSVTALEPSDDMRAIAAGRVAELPDADRFEVRAGTAEATGLPEASADVVTASQAMHWFDANRALPEIGRILRPGGVFAAFDCDWPPTVHHDVDAAYMGFDRAVRRLEVERGVRPAYAAKHEHGRLMADSGVFRFLTEIAMHNEESGNASRLVAVARSQGGAVALLAAGVPESALGLDRLRTVADEQMKGVVPWWWTYRIRLGVR